jgi:hypothetical protein
MSSLYEIYFEECDGTAMCEGDSNESLKSAIKIRNTA